MTDRSLLVRWSGRDLRRRWPQVAAISLVIALGTGTYAALLSTSAWRTQSNDASFATTHLHDLRVDLSDGTSVAEGRLAQIAATIPHASAITAMRERLLLATQVAGPHGLLVTGEIVGSAIGPGTDVDSVSRSSGRPISEQDDGRSVVVLDRQFATKNDLPATGRLLLSGGTEVQYVGAGQSPEYFIVSGGQGALPFMSQQSYGVLFATLHSAQALTGSVGRVNDLVLTTKPGTTATVRAELERALAGTRPAIAAEVTTRAEVGSYRVLYDDIEGDQRLWRIVALLVLLGAAFAAFNLTNRIVEAQRREIGIGLALGAPGRVLAVRPLLFGAEVALIGVALGLAVGVLVGLPLKDTFTSIVPLPIWRTPFQLSVFAQAAALGFALPFLAVAWPVWRAVRVEPVEAIRVGHLSARSRPHARLGRRLPGSGRSYRQMPVRNVLRTPRRTLLTVLGISAALATLVTTLGFLDSFSASLDRSEQSLLSAAPDRVAVAFRTLQADNGPDVRAVRELPGVREVDAGLLVPATANRGGRSVDLLTEVIGSSAPWRPALVQGRDVGGIVLAEKAADDLGVHVGGTVELVHPQLTAAGVRTATTSVKVAGLHSNPMRVFAYVDDVTARMFGMSGRTNLLTVVPAAGTSADEVRRMTLGLPAVGSAQAVRATTDGMRDSLEEFLGILRVAAGVTLLLALLIAFNTASIGMEERSREHATMLAFGLPSRTVVGLAVTESALIGLVATALGVGGGYCLLAWLNATNLEQMMPEMRVVTALSATTLVVAIGLGVLTVALAPLLAGRRLRKLDIPSTLRVVE